tara:strand:+ start:174 stop:335 length:162 start_codon:yes stop_codon:yes gene_type:complete
MHADLDRKRNASKQYRKVSSAKKKEAANAHQEQLRHKIAVAIVVAELLQESNG